MSNGRFVLGEAIETFRSGVRTPLFPLVFAGLIGYLVVVLLSAEYMQQMGAIDIPRNSPHIVFLMSTGQVFWLLFAWAWLFGRIVTRDREAQLHELVLSTPNSLKALLLGRYLGTVALASLLGVSAPLGFLIVGPMGAAGMLPPDAVGPVPWLAMAVSFVLFIVPVAAGSGALYLVAALRTKSVAGPFVAAGSIIAIWMLSMVILRGGEIGLDLATLIDPTAFGEVETQTNEWTPREKMTRMVSLTLPLILNRLLWGVLPLLPLALVLMRLRREDLVLDRVRAPRERRSAQVVAARRSSTPPAPLNAPNWLGATWSEATWHLRRLVRSWGLAMAAGLLMIMGVAGSYVHVVQHAEGPLTPRAELLTPLLGEFVYIIFLFIIAGFVGGMMRRDEQRGFYEIVGATPAPLGVRLGGRALAAVMLTVGLCLIPVMSAMVMTLAASPGGVAIATPLATFVLAFAPAMLEVCGATILVHAVVRRAGVAHTLTMILAFVAVLNHELSLVSYPPAQLAIPAPISLSALVGWEPWLPMVLAFGVLKLGVFVLAVGLAWVAWPRQLVEHWTDRLPTAARRLRGGAGVTCAVGLAIVVGCAWLLEERLVDSGRYVAVEQDQRDRAAWEQHWVKRGSAFSVAGGEVELDVVPQERTVTARWAIHGVQSSGEALHAELPPGVEIESALVQGQPTDIETVHDHVAVTLGPCAQQAKGCAVVLDVRATLRGWPAEEQTPWVDANQVWLHAHDVLPRLGLDPDRALQTPSVRAEQGLPPSPAVPAATASIAAVGVAPAAAWTFSVKTPQGWTIATEDRINGPLDFAVAWRPEAPPATTVGGRQAWHGPEHGQVAKQVLDDTAAIRVCIQAKTGWSLPTLDTVVQAPRDGTPSIAGDILWLPEDGNWDITGEGFGGWHRRFVIGRTIARHYIAAAAALRHQPGSRWLTEGVPGWLALECVRAEDGQSAWRALLASEADGIVQALGSLPSPVRGLAEDGDAEWVEAYAPAATYAWASAMGSEVAQQRVSAVVEQVARGTTVADALVAQLGSAPAAELLGVPLASDVTVAEAAGGHEVAVDGQRWRWGTGGWQSEGSTSRAVRTTLDGEYASVSTPGALPVDDEFFVLDAWPSFERSVEDNTWSR
ncbi:MAG: ABC transporter permease [Myxococcota bacterium]